MRALMLIAPALAVVSCTQPGMPPNNRFAQDMAGRVAGPPQSCVSTNNAENLHYVDPQTVAYGYGATIWINHLPGPCPGLRELSTIIVDAQDGTRYCRGNRIRGREPGAVIPGPWCNLGDWVPYRRP
jgi:hypothetical protein